MPFIQLVEASCIIFFPTRNRKYTKNIFVESFGINALICWLKATGRSTIQEFQIHSGLQAIQVVSILQAGTIRQHLDHPSESNSLLFVAIIS
jgi:hypothetical protein